MRFVLKIDNYDNAAMADASTEETARILEDVARKVHEGYTSGSVRDSNGNSVGSFEFIEED